MTLPVRVGVVGLGGMGLNHARNVEALGHDIVAGADVDPEARSRFAPEFDAATYEDYEAMYDDAAIDCVFITVPNVLHEPMATAALSRGIQVLCEKPLAHTLDAAERIAEAAAASDAFCMVGFHNRFSTAATVCTAYREEGRFGDLTHIDANFLRRRGIPGQGSWFTDPDVAGGGAVIDIGVHAIDYALHLAGFPAVEEVSAVTRSGFGTRADYVDPDRWNDDATAKDERFVVEDSASAFLRCAGDLTISLDVSWAANLEPSREFVVRGTAAGARLDLGGDDLSVFGVERSGIDHYTNTTIDGSLEPSGYKGEAKAFLDQVAADEPPVTNTVDEGLQVQRVVDAIYRSSERDAAVTV